MLNVYLHHFLDRQWHAKLGNPPLIRVGDDILVLCRKYTEAKAADADLQRRLHPAGMSLKHTVQDRIHDLRAGGSAHWLGISIAAAADRLSMSIPNGAWRGLRQLLADAHTKSDAPLRAIQTIETWLKQRGPSYRSSNPRAVCQQVLDTAVAEAFEELPTVAQLRHEWQLAHARWERLRRAVATQVRDGHQTRCDVDRANHPSTIAAPSNG